MNVAEVHNIDNTLACYALADLVALPIGLWGISTCRRAFIITYHDIIPMLKLAFSLPRDYIVACMSYDMPDINRTPGFPDWA